MNIPGFTAEASMYQSARYYVTIPSVASVRDGGLVSMTPTFVTPQGFADLPPCGDSLGGCYPTIDGSLLSICPCGSGGTCGPCFHLMVQGFDLGMKHICRCVRVDVPDCRSPNKCCEFDHSGKCTICIPRNAQCP